MRPSVELRAKTGAAKSCLQLCVFMYVHMYEARHVC